MLALWLGSPLFYYMTVAPGFSHAPGLFAVGLLLWLTLREWAEPTTGPGRFVLIGLVGGLAALVREQDGLFLVMPGLLLAGRVLGAEGRAAALRPIAQGLAMAAAAFLAFLPQLLAYRVFLRIPSEIAAAAGLSSLSLVDDDFTVQDPRLIDALFESARIVAGLESLPQAA